MISVLDSIKGLMRRGEGLPENMSSTEINHYSAELLNRLEHGETVEMLEVYLRRLNIPGSLQSDVSPGAHALAERAFAVFRS